MYYPFADKKGDLIHALLTLKISY